MGIEIDEYNPYFPEIRLIKIPLDVQPWAIYRLRLLDLGHPDIDILEEVKIPVSKKEIEDGLLKVYKKYVKELERVIDERTNPR